MRCHFEISGRLHNARRGRLTTPHGDVHTPVFMPVGTLATVKGVPQHILEELGAEILLSNTYHLFLRPGAEVVGRLGGLHQFMSWDRAILTDSGGFQVFSLAPLRKVSEEGVQFRSHLDGSPHFLSPEKAMAAQMALGADILMVFDECTEYPAERSRARASMELTLRWAERSKRSCQMRVPGCGWGEQQSTPYTKSTLSTKSPLSTSQLPTHNSQLIFGIVQGGMYPDLRAECAQRLVEMNFDGYAIGGLSVGEPRERTYEMVTRTLEHLPPDKPRYVMGVGTPEEIVSYARLGIDLMDCVLPTRAARHGLLFTSEGRLNIKGARFAEDQGPPDPRCGCWVCSRYSRAYLRHLYAAQEVLALVLNSVHNLAFYLDTMQRLRQSISSRDFSGLPPLCPATGIPPGGKAD